MDETSEHLFEDQSLSEKSSDPVTTQKELYAWYCYDWANSVYSSISIGIFIPVFLVTIAKEAAGCDVDSDEDDECDKKVSLGAFEVLPTAFAFYSITISVFLQALCFISIAPIADYGSFRKSMMLFFAFGGSILTMLYILIIDESVWWIAGILTILSNVFFGCAIVFYNAYLPLLVKNHPQVLEAAPLDYIQVEEKVSNDISTRGFAAGYSSPLILLAVCAGIVMSNPSSTGYRICIFLSGAWWFAFTIPFVYYVHPRPGQPLPKDQSFLTFGWKRVYKTFRSAKKLPNTFLYLLSYFIFSDGVGTVGSVGVLFGTEELGLSGIGLVVIAALVPLSALIGNISFLWMQRRLGWRPKKMIQFHLVFLTLLPLYGIMGLFAPFGLVTLAELYIFAVVYGINLGSIQSFSRTVFSDLIPEGYESEFFGLYEITDKGSSWIGPLLVSIILQTTGSMRWALFVLVVFFLFPLWMLTKLDVDQGRKEVEAFHRNEVNQSAVDGEAGLQQMTNLVQ